MEPQGVTSRTEVLERLARGLASRASSGRVLRLAIDGPDAVGKSTFARDLDDVLHRFLPDGAEVRRFSADNHMISIQGRRSAQAADPRWLYDNFLDLKRIREIARGVPETSPSGSVVIIEGMTLQRPELADLWDVTVYMSVSAELTIERAGARYASLIDVTEEPDEIGDMERRYRERYMPAYRLYIDDVAPHERADIFVDMTDFDAPRVERWNGF
ncbi:hypothetical protein [Georgenia yuyongxinii]|uniref:Uridine kinase n=1 Tax=Georgenia yuyongxinii TaxID=2589797 RepID=A0A552WK65_9MICO|nr:hypothetical protein [Georgenia yuyongxinii]TRW43126.1 hypothetical protein FJ693_18890 [Georgenia yuyongxinii]